MHHSLPCRCRKREASLRGQASRHVANRAKYCDFQQRRYGGFTRQAGMRRAPFGCMIATETSRRPLDGLLFLLAVVPVVAVLTPPGARKEDVQASHLPDFLSGETRH